MPRYNPHPLRGKPQPPPGKSLLYRLAQAPGAAHAATKHQQRHPSTSGPHMRRSAGRPRPAGQRRAAVCRDAGLARASKQAPAAASTSVPGRAGGGKR